MKVLELVAETRNESGHKARVQGYVPGIIYGMPEGLKIKIKQNVFQRFYNKTLGGVSLVRVKIEDKVHDVVIKEIQKNSTGDKFLHVDFQPVKAGQPISLKVPVELVGEAKGAKEGGIVEHLLHEAWIEVLPSNLIEKVEVDISNLGIGESIHIGDLNIEGVKFLEKPEETIVTVVVQTEGTEEETEENTEA